MKGAQEGMFWKGTIHSEICGILGVQWVCVEQYEVPWRCTNGSQRKLRLEGEDERASVTMNEISRNGRKTTKGWEFLLTWEQKKEDTVEENW